MSTFALLHVPLLFASDVVVVVDATSETKDLSGKMFGIIAGGLVAAFLLLSCLFWAHHHVKRVLAMVFSSPMDKEQNNSQNVQRQTGEFTAGAQTMQELSEEEDEQKQEMKPNKNTLGRCGTV